MEYDSHIPSVSVLMAVYNGRRFIEESVNSILEQTFNDFEFIIIDDGSDDGTGEWLELKKREDKRIRLIRQKNAGLTTSLNAAIKLAKGEFIARMDADDISCPDRLKVSLDYIQSNPDVDIVGTWCKIIDEDGKEIGTLENPVTYSEILWHMLSSNPIAHPSALVRKSAFDEYGTYDDTFTYAQDYELWVRWAMQKAKLANIPQCLMSYRLWNHQISSFDNNRQTDYALQAAQIYAGYWLGREVPQRDVVGMRQLLGASALTEHAIFSIPTVINLMKVDVFQEAITKCREKIFDKFYKSIMQYGSQNSRYSLFNLLTLLAIGSGGLLDKRWWYCMISLLSPRQIVRR